MSAVIGNIEELSMLGIIKICKLGPHIDYEKPDDIYFHDVVNGENFNCKSSKVGYNIERLVCIYEVKDEYGVFALMYAKHKHGDNIEPNCFAEYPLRRDTIWLSIPNTIDFK